MNFGLFLIQAGQGSRVIYFQTQYTGNTLLMLLMIKLLRNGKLHELQYNRLLSWGAFEFVFISVLFHRKRSGKFAIPLRDRHKTRA